MTNNDAINNRPEQLGTGGADCSKTDEQVSQALQTLRLLNDTSNPFSLRQMISRACEMVDIYTRWEQSGTLIKDLVVRLSDGQEIAVDQSKVASLCGLRFRNSFPSDAILHVWKQADDQFGEVQLLSLSLQDVQANGYDYAKNYKNGQTLSLRVVRCSDGQFYISVDWTVKEHATAATPNTHGWLPLLGSALIVFSKAISFLTRPQIQQRHRWTLRPSTTFVAGLMFATACCFLLLRKTPHPVPNHYEVENTKTTLVATNAEAGNESKTNSTEQESADGKNRRQTADTERKMVVDPLRSPNQELLTTVVSDKSTFNLSAQASPIDAGNTEKPVSPELRPPDLDLKITANNVGQPRAVRDEGLREREYEPRSLSDRAGEIRERRVSSIAEARESGDRFDRDASERRASDRASRESGDRSDRVRATSERGSSDRASREPGDRSDGGRDASERRLSSGRETRQSIDPEQRSRARERPERPPRSPRP